MTYCDTSYKDLPLLCPLTRCILEKDTDALKRIIRKRTKNRIPLKANSEGWTALHRAALNDEYADCLKLLLSNKDALKLNLDAEIYTGETALFLACAEGCLKNCRILLDSQCTRNQKIRNKDGYAPLHIASIRGHAGIVSQLLAHGLDPNCRVRNFIKSTPLSLASDADNLDVVRVLMASKRTKVNLCNGFGELPLHRACEMGHLEILRILVEADRGLMNGEKGFTPLCLAIKYRHVECVKYLLEQGANASLCISGHETIFHYAVVTGVREIVELVLQTTSLTHVNEQFIQRTQSFLSAKWGTFHSWLTYSIHTCSLERIMLPLLESCMPKGVLETPYIRYIKRNRCYLYSPLAYIFYEAKLYFHVQDLADKHLRLLLQHNITHLSEFTQMVNLKDVRNDLFICKKTFLYVHPFTYIFKGRWSPMQCDHYLSTLFEYGITTDYCLECDVYYNSRFLDFDLEVLFRFYKPVVLAIQKDNAEFIELLLIHSAILEPSHMWDFVRDIIMSSGRSIIPHNVVNYLIDLGVFINTSNLPLYAFRRTIECPNLQQWCRQAIRKQLRDVTIRDNLKNFKQKIDALPLPNSLKNYLNFKRR